MSNKGVAMRLRKQIEELKELTESGSELYLLAKTFQSKYVKPELLEESLEYTMEVAKHALSIINQLQDEIKQLKEKLKREEQSNSLGGAVYDLKQELEHLNNSGDLKITTKNIVEDMLQKKLARLADKAQEVVNAHEDHGDKWRKVDSCP